MSAELLDADLILSANEHWMKLDQDWKPVDLETEEDSKLSPVFSTLDLRKSTFDSSFLTKKVRRKVGRRMSQISKKSSDLDYNDFLQDLEDENTIDLPLKQFYFVSGQILSALSVEEICDKIDDIFKSVEKLCSATSTIRKKKATLPDIVQCSISTTDLSFDDTNEKFEEKGEVKKGDDDDVDRYIDEAFEHFNSTIMSLHNVENMNDATKESVTSLVKKFSSILESPIVHCSPRRKRRCSEQFRDLAEFWNRKALENN